MTVKWIASAGTERTLGHMFGRQVPVRELGLTSGQGFVMNRSISVRVDQRPVEQNGRTLDALDRSVGDPRVTAELDLITRDIAFRTGAQTGVLACWNQTEEIVDFICAWGAAPMDDRSRIPAHGRLGFVGRVLDSGHAALEPIDSDHDLSLGIAASGERLTHAAGAAVRPPGRPPGALCVGFSSPPDDPAVTQWLIERYAGLASLSLYDPSVLDGRLVAARIDELTGCMSYAAVHVELEREIARSARHRRSVSCCFIDLDGFKRVNERHGHLHGSRVLAGVAELLRGALRMCDTLGRYGGDEFVAILPDTDEAAAGMLAERLRSTIATATSGGANDSLDASVGVAQWRTGATAEETLAAANEALHRAKGSGGGTVVRADEVATPAGRDAAGRGM
jgi:diguanylate cyclase (GGDEF)-like protein